MLAKMKMRMPVSNLRPIAPARYGFGTSSGSRIRDFRMVPHWEKGIRKMPWTRNYFRIGAVALTASGNNHENPHVTY
jgi:hypothetical protein